MDTLTGPAPNFSDAPVQVPPRAHELIDGVPDIIAQPTNVLAMPEVQAKVVNNKEPVSEQLPVIKPAEQLEADGTVQTLVVSSPETKAGGHLRFRLADLDPILSKRQGFTVDGTPGDLMAVLDISDIQLGIVDTKREQGYEAGYEYDDERFILVKVTHPDKNLAAPFYVEPRPNGKGSMSTYLHEPDTRIIADRSRPSMTFEMMGLDLKNDPYLSQRNTEFYLDENGQLMVEDHRSLNGTRLFVRPNKLEQQSAHDIQSLVRHARSIDDTELVRERGNGGQEIDADYRENQTNARNLFVDRLLDGGLYGSDGKFINSLKEAHRLASSNNVYDKVGKGHLFNEESPGEFRTQDATSKRLKQAQRASQIAAQYGDPYANRFEPQATGRSVTRVKLDGISPDAEVIEYVEYENGHIKDYGYEYPDFDTIDEYMHQMRETGVQLMQELQKPEPNIDHSLDLIAQQYQYGVIARPFDQINNSLFMNLVNAQLKLVGFRSIPHGQLDILAQRLRPENFGRLFADYVAAQQKRT